MGIIIITFVDVELDKSLELAHQLNIYAYDAYLIQCALKYQIPLISLDRNLRRYAKQKNITVMEVSL
ncbi:MAG: type II toxin-antitoxin system VapC family toxin [bacterium]|nr:type II toxin-antitoxin system VapC family toxin [bacterium]